MGSQAISLSLVRVMYEHPEETNNGINNKDLFTFLRVHPGQLVFGLELGFRSPRER